MDYLLADVICQTFMKEVGTFQSRPKSENTPLLALEAFDPEEGWSTVARFSKEMKAQAFVDASYTRGAGPKFRPETLLGGKLDSYIRQEDHFVPIDPKPPVQLAMKIRFNTHADYDKEEGYRFLDLVIYGPTNYVQVWVRTAWDVIPVEDLEYDEDREGRIKKGKSYQKGVSDWKCVGNHDSGWRDSVRQVLRDNSKILATFNSLNHWFEIVPVTTLNLPEKTR